LSESGAANYNIIGGMGKVLEIRGKSYLYWRGYEIMGLNELDSCLKNKEEQEQNERIQQILEMFRKQLNEQTTAEYEEYKAKSRRDPNAFTIMFTDPLDDLDDPDEMND
jgi:hypothetical protein